MPNLVNILLIVPFVFFLPVGLLVFAYDWGALPRDSKPYLALGAAPAAGRNLCGIGRVAAPAAGRNLCGTGASRRAQLDWNWPCSKGADCLGKELTV